MNYHLCVVFSARCNIYISRLCYDVSVRLFVRLSICDGSALALVRSFLGVALGRWQSFDVPAAYRQC